MRHAFKQPSAAECRSVSAPFSVIVGAAFGHCILILVEDALAPEPEG
jgi:hypothetical protein